MNSLTSLDTIRPAAAPPRAEIDREVFDERGFVVPHYRQFTSILNLFSRTYSYRWDEAVSQSQENAEAMKRDVFFRRLIQERTMPLRHWKWHVEPEKDLVNPKAPHSAEREKAASILTALVESIPRFGDMRLYLGQAAWHGRYGAQLAFHKDHVGGLNLWKAKAHLPVDGDKIQYDWDETPAVYVNTSEIAKYPADLHLLTDRYTALKLGTPQLRRRFVIHRHTVEDAGFFNPFQAGRVAGIGLRDFSYWGWWLRDEVLSWLVDFAEKVGSLGLLLFLYPEGSIEGKAQAEANAKNANNRNALAVPIPKGADRRQVGVEAVTLPTAGVDFLLKVVRDYFEKHIEHLFVGQSMSTGGEGDGQLGGTGRAEFAKDTQFLLFKGDAEGLAETFSVDLLPTFQAFNHLDEQWRYYFRFGVPDPGAKDKLEAITKAASLPGKKLEYKADEVRELVGMSKPEDGDETIGGNEQPPGGPMGPGGPGQAPPNGQQPPGSPPGQAGGLPQGQQGQQPDATGGSPSPDGGEGDSQPVPGMAELVTAMFRAASEGDWQTVRELRMLTADPDGFQAMLEDLDGGDDTAQYAWTAGTTKRTGKVKAVGTGEHEGRTLYGKRAEAALRSKPDGAAETPHPARQRARDLAAQRETARIPAREAYQKALADPGSLQPADLAALEDHLKTLKRDELRQHVEAAGSKTYGRVKAELVDKLLEHVRGPRGGGSAPKPVADEEVKPSPETAATSATSATSADVADVVRPGEVRTVPTDHMRAEAAGKKDAPKAATEGKPQAQAAEPATTAPTEAKPMEAAKPNESAKGIKPESVGSDELSGRLAAMTPKEYAAYVAADPDVPDFMKGDPNTLEFGHTNHIVRALRSGQDVAPETLAAYPGRAHLFEKAKAEGAMKAGAKPPAAAPVVKAKEPHEMTRDEFAAHMNARDSATKQRLQASIESGGKLSPVELKPGQANANSPAENLKYAQSTLARLEARGTHTAESVTDQHETAKQMAGGESEPPKEEPKPAPAADAGRAEPAGLTPIPLADHTALAGAIHEAAGGLKDWMGQTADENGTREHASNVHKVQTADLYDALKGRLPAGTTLDQFKRTLVEMNHAGALSLSRIDMPQYAKDQARLRESEAAHHNATFHVVTVPGDKLKPAAAKHLPADDGPGHEQGEPESTSSPLDKSQSSGKVPLTPEPASSAGGGQGKTMQATDERTAENVERLRRSYPNLTGDELERVASGIKPGVDGAANDSPSYEDAHRQAMALSVGRAYPAATDLPPVRAASDAQRELAGKVRGRFLSQIRRQIERAHWASIAAERDGRGGRAASAKADADYWHRWQAAVAGASDARKILDAQHLDFGGLSDATADVYAKKLGVPQPAKGGAA